LRAWALAETPTTQKEAFGEIQKLATRESAVTDFDALQYLKIALEELADNEALATADSSVTDLGATLWRKAIKANPNDERLSKEVFFWFLAAGDWKGAQQVSCSSSSLPN